MASLEPFVLKIKPAMDAFLRAPTKHNLAKLEHELSQFHWVQMKIFHVQILLPLVLKLEELSGDNQELRTGTLNCIRLVISKLYLKDVKGLRTILVIALKQIRECDSATAKTNLSEEMKLAAVQCIAEAIRRSTTDVLELFYTKESSMLLGQILLTLVEFIEGEKYRTLVVNSMHCLMVAFYVHDQADSMDVVLRNQVADTLFIFLPKVVTILFKASLTDEKLGETLKSTAIKALGRILCVIYEETNDAAVIKINNYDIGEFKRLMEAALKREACTTSAADDIYETLDRKKRTTEQLEERLKRMQGDGRSPQWFVATSRKLRVIFVETCILRSHSSTRIREEYAQMCCMLMQRCAHHLKDNFMHMLENVVAMSEDADERIRRRCQEVLRQLQDTSGGIFDENCELLFDEHLTRLPRIINRCDDDEQYAELLFLKGFLRNLSATRLQLLLSLPRNLEMFCMCLLALVDLKSHSSTRRDDLLAEEYALRAAMSNEDVAAADYSEYAKKLPWRQFKNLNSLRSVQTVRDICGILGETRTLNRILYDYLLGLLLEQQHAAINEIILVMVWMATTTTVDAAAVDQSSRFELVAMLLDEILSDNHWHLALQPDQVWRLKIDKPSNWFVDRTPGLYESAIEIRMQNCDSDDENDLENVESSSRVTIADAQFNVLHTCIILDALGQCATFLRETFDKYLFRSLHKVLLKVASSNSMIYQASNFALISMQKALRFAKTSHFLEAHTDYITFHLNTILKRSPESRAAVDILTVVLQLSTRNALPHLDSIFQTIRNECTKAHQCENINSYLRVFNAFLTHVSRWQSTCDQEINNISMQIDVDAHEDATDILAAWINVLETPAIDDANVKFNLQSENNENKSPNIDNTKESENSETEENEETSTNECDMKVSLPRHVEMTKEIVNQVLKFVSSTEQSHQILALECLISGLALLKDYENELLPLVHLIWQPLVEKFRQKDAIVLNRCFTLLTILATHAKEFILKRSLDDVIPFLKQFLKEAALHSALESTKVPTQEYKLQLKLLEEFSNLIQSMQIDGKNLNEISEVLALYLAKEQPEELQDHAIEFYKTLRFYNGPLVYLSVLKKSHLKEYSKNVAKVLIEFGIK